MDEIGVRTLKATLSAVLREVSQGRRVRITARGRAVADLVPPASAGEEETLRSLVSAGRIRAPSRSHPKQAPELVEPRTSASDLVLEDREAER
jgi:prevent-host-death family protein